MVIQILINSKRFYYLSMQHHRPIKGIIHGVIEKFKEINFHLTNNVATRVFVVVTAFNGCDKVDMSSSSHVDISSSLKMIKNMYFRNFEKELNERTEHFSISKPPKMIEH